MKYYCNLEVNKLKQFEIVYIVKETTKVRLR